jgi:hypothetical protein
MKAAAVDRYRAKVVLHRESVTSLLRSGRVKRLEYRGEAFFIRRFGAAAGGSVWLDDDGTGGEG